MKTIFQERLRELVTQRWDDIQQDYRLCENYLKDIFPGHKKQVFLIVNAMREGVPKRLEEIRTGTLSYRVVRARLTSHLMTGLGLDQTAAEWAVETWAFALGLLSESVIRDNPPQPSSSSPQAMVQSREIIDDNDTGVNERKPYHRQSPSAADMRRSNGSRSDRPDQTLEWFIIETLKGSEQRTVEKIRRSLRRADAEERCPEVLAPTETVVEMQGGKRMAYSRMFYPGYILIKVECVRRHIPDDIFRIIADTPGVAGFVGGQNPTPLTTDEVISIVDSLTQTAETTKPNILYKVGEKVRIKSGPFASFPAKVEEVNEDESRLKIVVTIFGRPTPVELSFQDVESVIFAEEETE